MNNFPSHVQTSADNSPISTSVLNVRGVSLSFREFADGYISVNSTFGSARKATLETYGQMRGFLGALDTLMDAPEGVFVPGFHCTGGLGSIANIWDATSKPVAYVHWGFLKDLSIIETLADHGIVKSDEGNYWVALGVKRGHFFRMFVNRPQKWEEFTEWLRTEKGIEDPKAPEARMFVKDWYEKAWAIQNRHDGFEIALNVIAGTNFAGMHKPSTDVDLAKFNREYELLFGQGEARTQYRATQQANGEADRKLRATVYAIAASDQPELGEYALSAIDGDVTIYASAGETSVVKRSSLVGKRVMFVYADGSRLPKGGTAKLHTDAHITGALQLAQNYRALIALA